MQKIIKFVATIIGLSTLVACTSTQVQVIDKCTKEPISNAYVYIRPMQTLPFAIDPLNILLKTEANGMVEVQTSSFYIDVLKDGYSLANSAKYDKNLNIHTVELEKDSGINRIILNLTTNELLKLKENNSEWRDFLSCCDKNNIRVITRKQ